MAEQAVTEQVRAAESGAETPGRTVAPDLVRDYIRAVAEQAVTEQVRAAESGAETPGRTVAPDFIRNYIKTISEQAIDTQVRNAEIIAEVNARIRTVPNPTEKITSLVLAELVEGMPYLQENGRPRVISSVGVTDKYDETHLDTETSLRSNEAVSFGHAFTDGFQSMKKGKQLLVDYFSPKVAEALQAQRVKTVVDPSSSEAEKTKSMYEAVTTSHAFEMTAHLIGSIGDMMDVFGTVMLFTDAFYMNDKFQDYGQSEAKAATGITPKLLTKENVMTALKFSIDAQITGIKGYNDRCKARNVPTDNGFPYVYATYPLITGPLDHLEKKVYDSQSRFWIEINNVRERLLRDPTKPYKAKMQLLLGGDVYDSIANDSTKKLWWYVNGTYGVFGNTDTDSLYREAYRSVCEYNNGRVYEDTHAGVDSNGVQDPNMFGRVRMQCGWKTPGECVVAANKWALDKGKSGGNYAEWYNWSDLTGTDNVLKVPMNHPLRSTPGVTGACIVTNSGIRQMCEVAKGSYDATTHACTFTPQFCQSIATCWDSVSQTCYLPTNAIHGVGVLFGDGAPREFIKVYGCNISGKDALNFIPPFSIFSDKGLEWFRDIAANKENLNDNFKSLLSSPAYAAGFATSALGVGMFTAQSISPSLALSTRWNVGIAVAMMAVIGITIGVEYGDDNKTNGRFPTNDPNEYTVGGWQADSSGAHLGPKSTAFAYGWVTKPLPLKANGTPLTSFEDGLNGRLPGMFTCKFFDDQAKITFWKNGSAGNLSAGVDAYLFGTKWPRKVTCHTGCASSGGGNWAVQGSPQAGIRAGSNGSADKIWCLPPFPDASYADSAIGPLATEDTTINTNRTWTSGKAPTWAQYPTGDPGAPLSGTAFKGGESDSINQWKYQLVYKKDPSDTERKDPNSTWWNSTTNMPKKIWDTTYLRQYFTDSRIGEMRQYYCRIAFAGHIKDKTPFDQLCYGYMSVDLEKYTVLPMTVLARTTRITPVSSANQCQPGQGPAAVTGACTGCPAGTYNSLIGGACMLCPAGQSSTVGSTSCTNCLAGQSSVSGGLCTPCPANQNSIAGGLCSIICAAGQINSSVSTCTNCPAGQSSVAGINGSCTNCPAGQSSVAGSACTNCSAGQISVAGGLCTNCPAGQSSASGDSSCTNCPAGQSSMAGGTCTNCLAGESSVAGGLCKSCLSGQTSVAGSASCTNCPNGTATGSDGPSGFIRSQEIIITGGNQITLYPAVPSGFSVYRQNGPSEQSCKDACSASPQCAGFTRDYGTIWGTCTFYSSITSITGVTGAFTTLRKYNGCTPCPTLPGGTFEDYCIHCPDGQAVNKGVCIKACPAGQYSSGSNVPCIVCQAGTYSIDNSSSCTSCKAGTYSSGPGSASCDVCPAGQSSTVGSTLCTNCLAGQYSYSGGLCITCDPGYYSLQEGSTSCTTCSDGFISLGGANSCTECPSSQYANKSICVDACPVKYYKRNCVGSCPGYNIGSVCMDPSTTCWGGYEVKYLSGAYNCSICSAGKFSSAGGSCQNCSAGQSSTAGSSSCTSCPAGQSSTAGGLCTACSSPTPVSVSGGLCLASCPGGYYTSGSQCLLACPGGTYSYGTSCVTQCPAGTYVSGTTCQNCSAGQSSTAGSSSCTNCSAGQSSTAGGLCTACSSPTPVSVSGGLCLASCPGGYYTSGSQCLSSCPSGTYTYGTSCVTQCPSGTAPSGTTCIASYTYTQLDTTIPSPTASYPRLTITGYPYNYTSEYAGTLLQIKTACNSTSSCVAFRCGTVPTWRPLSDTDNVSCFFVSGPKPVTTVTNSYSYKTIVTWVKQ